MRLLHQIVGLSHAALVGVGLAIGLTLLLHVAEWEPVQTKADLCLLLLVRVLGQARVPLQEEQTWAALSG